MTAATARVGRTSPARSSRRHEMTAIQRARANLVRTATTLGPPRPPPTDTCLRDGSHHKRHQFTAQGAGIVGRSTPPASPSSGDARRRAGRIVSFSYGFSKTGEQELIKIAAETAKRRRSRSSCFRASAPGRHPRGAGQRQPDLPDRDPLHRGRRVDPALRAGARPRAGDRRVLDDEPRPAARRCSRSRPGSWSTPGASACTSWTRPAR